ncbi:DUF6167 family protein [Nocardioides marmorisolisilvae]|uniref:Uncharacterized protein n=1 Tax=Nocardioides marmorisolisilvae TaxID=1542737 RepID=A0A3N0DUA9_9ACTN|nr:DUF6167 family protein [Nocardioides marmorisolisilvae]RNL79212.1 hypothetical protein EFL95_09315 [Nocardioides marmorisolisilvae]
MRRGFWFVAGAGAGVYVMIRARRAAEAFTPDGVRDRLAGLQVGAHLFLDEVRTGMDERETELRERFALLERHSVLDGPLELTASTTDESPLHPYDLPGTHPGTPALEGKH